MLYPKTSLVLTASLHLAFASDACYWKRSNQIKFEGPDSPWFACNNTQQIAGGAQLCCINGSQCGEDSICHTSSSTGGSGWYVGGCTDKDYEDPVCRSSCTGDSETFIEYNNTEGLWHCCGDKACDGNPTDETFQAVAPLQWTAVPSVPKSTSTTNPSATGDQASTQIRNGLSTGAKIGIGISSAVAGLAVVASVVFFVLWRRAKKAATLQGAFLPHNGINGEAAENPHRPRKAGSVELSEQDAAIKELPAEGV